MPRLSPELHSKQWCVYVVRRRRFRCRTRAEGEQSEPVRLYAGVRYGSVMRILRVAPWIYPDTKGGGDYHVHAMSRDQAAMGHDVTVLTTRVDRSLQNRGGDDLQA